MSAGSIYSQGVHGSGSRDYSDAEYLAVVDVLRGLGQADAMTVTELARRTGVLGRTVREIVSAADGVDILIGTSGPHGYTVARTRGQADGHTAKLMSQAARMVARGHRRIDYAQGLPEA